MTRKLPIVQNNNKNKNSNNSNGNGDDTEKRKKQKGFSMIIKLIFHATI